MKFEQSYNFWKVNLSVVCRKNWEEGETKVVRRPKMMSWIGVTVRM